MTTSATVEIRKRQWWGVAPSLGTRIARWDVRLSPEFDVTVFLVTLGVADQTPSVDRRYNGRTPNEFGS